MTGQPERVFLDANVLFSAAFGSHACRLLLTLPDIALFSSDYCVDEAQRNLRAKAPNDATRWLGRTLSDLQVVATPPPPAWQEVASHLPQKAVNDRPVLAAAVAVRADVLVTGNTRDFGALMRNPAPGLPIVLTPRAFLIRGPRHE